MSTRQLRKLQKQRELEKVQQLAAQDSDGSDEDDGGYQVAALKPRVSLFAALQEDDEDAAQDAEEEPEPEPQEVKKEARVVPSSKRSKKKKKKKAKAAAAAPKVEENRSTDDEFDAALREANLITDHGRAEKADTTTSPASNHRINELLSVNPYHLKAMNEMRNLFGREIIESAEAEEEQERSRRRRGPEQREVDLETFLRSPPGAKRLPEVSLRRNVFIQGRDHWPCQTAGGLTMKEIRGAEDGSWTEYAYMHCKDYHAVQVFFFSCVQIGDPMRMVHLLKEVRKCSPTFLRLIPN